MKAIGNRVSWVRYGIIKNVSYMCKDYVCFGTGCHLQFLNLTTRETTTFTANFSSINGDGISVIDGHKTSYTFAYAEHIYDGNLYVKNFPEFEDIAVFKHDSPTGYIAIAFSETSYLIALANLPYFTMHVFNWRKNERITVATTDIILEEQILSCSWGKPILIAQMGKKSNKLYYWDLFTLCKKTILEKHEVRMPSKDIPPLSDVVWTSEGTLFVIDVKGNIYMCDLEFILVKVVSLSVEGDFPTTITWYKGGLTTSGPDQVIRHYKKSDTWICDWVFELEVPLKEIHCNRTDFIFAVTVSEELVKLSNIDGLMYFHLRQSKFTDFCLIYPTASHIVALSQHEFLTVFNVDNGNWESTFSLSGYALCVQENPEFPYVAVGYNDGRLELVSAYNSEKLDSIACINLCSIPLTSVKFFEKGRVIVTGNLIIGKFFILEVTIGSKINILGHIEVGRQIVDYMLVGSKHCQRLFVIPVTSTYLAGNEIIRYCVIDKDNINMKQYFAENKEALYYRIIASDKPNRDRVFYALCLTSRNIKVLEIRRGDSITRVTSEIKTGHQLKKFDLRLNSRHALTWGFDGFVIARCNEFENEIGMALPHHRNYGGVKKAYMDISGKFIISLGRDQILTCTDLVENIFDEIRIRESVVLMASPKFLIMFRTPTVLPESEERFSGKTWLEIQEILKTEEEEKICRAKKTFILEEFNEIKETLRSMVTKNLTGPENEKIDLLEFYLDTVDYNQKKLQNKEECKQTETYMKALIVAQDKVTAFLKDNYLGKGTVMSKVIRGIFQKTLTCSYTLLPPDQKKVKLLVWIEEIRKIEDYLSVTGAFLPAFRRNKSEALQFLRCRIGLVSQDYAGMARRYAEESFLHKKNLESQVALEGTVSKLYIDRNPANYLQIDLVTFYQIHIEQLIAELDMVKLKEEYNKAFEQMMEEKCREIESIKKRHARMRHIISEYNYFSVDKMTISIIDPEWTQDEQPWLIEKVLENEMSVTPYISPSEQAILEAKAAEEERIRLALLADDFRERALMAMMNGVLEIKWEDELKKDVPLPKCMIEKDPAEFNEEDLRAIRDYEEKVAFLNSERERYKNLLDVEYSKLAVNLRDSIKKFNSRLKDNIEYKMNIDAGIKQEDFIINRSMLNQHRRMNLLEQIKEIKRDIITNERLLAELNDTMQELVEIQTDCKAQFETYQAKEKFFDKAFKKEFVETSPVIQEQAIKLYRKRPRVTIRHMNTSVALFELAKCVISGTKSKILPLDYLEYLKSLEQLETIIALPPYIDENTFHLISKHRRQRIEYEIKVRANQIELQDGDIAVSTIQKRISIRNDKIAALQTELENLRNDYLHHIHNFQCQLVMRRGLVELALTGEMKDFDDAILVRRAELEDINKRIKDAGQKKINTVDRNMAFRRHIMATEWEHKKMRMQINDYIEHIKDIASVKFTRDMQQYLKSKALGRKPDSYEQQIEVITLCYENTLRDKKEKHKKIMRQMMTYKDHNSQLDKAIQDVNIDVCHLKLQEDVELQKKSSRIGKERMEILIKRNSLVKEIQQNHNDILVLQTELELLRLKTYPTFKYKLINSSE